MSPRSTRRGHQKCMNSRFPLGVPPHRDLRPPHVLSRPPLTKAVAALCSTLQSRIPRLRLQGSWHTLHLHLHRRHQHSHCPSAHHRPNPCLTVSKTPKPRVVKKSGRIPVNLMYRCGRSRVARNSSSLCSTCSLVSPSSPVWISDTL